MFSAWQMPPAPTTPNSECNLFHSPQLQPLFGLYCVMQWFASCFPAESWGSCVACLVGFPVSMTTTPSCLLSYAWQQLYIYLSSFVINYSENLTQDDYYCFITYSHYCHRVWKLNVSSLLPRSQELFHLFVVRLKKCQTVLLCQSYWVNRYIPWLMQKIVGPGSDNFSFLKMSTFFM